MTSETAFPEFLAVLKGIYEEMRAIRANLQSINESLDEMNEFTPRDEK
jgi:hypothetical protein